jgi:CRISPR-associated exonuclease Cas4
VQGKVERNKRDYRHALHLALLTILVAASFILLSVSLYADSAAERRLSLVALALVLTLCSTTLLTYAIVSQQVYRRLQRESGLVPGHLVQSDLMGQAPMLTDPATGLNGRPDFLLQTSEGLVPVEVKTSRTPPHPYASHRLQVACYLRLLEVAGQRPAYGMLRYPEGVFRIEWDAALRADLDATLERLRAAQAAGRADRDHEHPGRCRGCARRSLCDQRLA